VIDRRGGVTFRAESIAPFRNGYVAYVWVTTPNGQTTRKYVYGPDRDTLHAKWVKPYQEAAERANPDPGSHGRRLAGDLAAGGGAIL
jgi:hypothetical protein